MNEKISKPLQLKTIEKICKGKLLDWAKSVAQSDYPEKDKIVEIIKTKTIITGGSLVSMLSGEEINDFDVYFRDKQSAAMVARYYLKKFKDDNNKWMSSKIHNFEVRDDYDRIRILIQSAGVASSIGEESPVEYQYFEATRHNEAEEYIDHLVNNAAKKDKGYAPVFISDNAITLSNQIQVIIRFFGEPEEIHKNYDFVHCTNYYSSWDEKVYINMDAMESIRTKNLKYTGSLYPICSLIRLRKFIKRGWKINAGQILKMAYQVNKLDLNDHEVLKEQLVGVDAAYFAELLETLKDDKESGKTIDQLYISNLIDKIFDQ